MHVNAPTVTTAARRRLTREQIVVTARQLLDADGLDSFTMSRLGDALGTTSMAVYRHFDDRQELITAVVASVLDELIVDEMRGAAAPAADVASWMYSVRTHLTLHPWLPRLLGDGRHISSAWVRVLSRLLTHLERCQLSPQIRGRELVRISRTTMGAVIQELSLPLTSTQDLLQDLMGTEPGWVDIAPSLIDYTDDRFFEDLVASTLRRLVSQIDGSAD